MPRSSAAAGLAEPMSKPRYTWTLSAPTISPPCSSASSTAAPVFPVAGGPAMTRRSITSAPEAALELGERNGVDDRPAVGTVAAEVVDRVHRTQERLALGRRER